MSGLPTHTEAELEEWKKLVKAKQELESAISELPAEESRDYMQACEMAADLVDKESNAAWFLKAEDFMAKPAAVRLTTYWRNRVKLFGDRAFYPILDLRGTGALHDADLEFLKTGAVVQLPNDTAGRCVTCNDISRLDDKDRSTNDKEIRLRITFYFFTKIAIENRVQQEVVSIRILRGAQFQLQQFNTSRFKLFQESFPAKLHAYHICCIPKAGSRKQFVGTIIPATVQQMGKSLAHIAKIHMDYDPAKIAVKLEKCGLRREGLPETLGGSWSYDDYLTKQFSSSCASNKNRKRSPASPSARKKKKQQQQLHSWDNEDRKLPPKTQTSNISTAAPAAGPQENSRLLEVIAAAIRADQSLSNNRLLQASIPPSPTITDVARQLSLQRLLSEPGLLEALMTQQQAPRRQEFPAYAQAGSSSLDALRRAAISYASDPQVQEQQQLQTTLRDLQLLRALQSKEQQRPTTVHQAPRLQQQIEAASALALLGSQGSQDAQRTAVPDRTLPLALQGSLHDSPLISALRGASQGAAKRTAQDSGRSLSLRESDEQVAALRKASRDLWSNEKTG